MARYEADVELLLLFVSLVVKFRLPVDPGATLPLLLAVTVKQAVFCCGVTITVACMARGSRSPGAPRRNRSDPRGRVGRRDRYSGVVAADIVHLHKDRGAGPAEDR